MTCLAGCMYVHVPRVSAAVVSEIPVIDMYPCSPDTLGLLAAMQGRVNRNQKFLHPADGQKKSFRVSWRPRFQLGSAAHALPAVDAVGMQQSALYSMSNQADSW